MISLIVAYANQNVIGFKGNMPWRLPNDLKRVKELTTGNTIVMGRTTYESLGRPLPNRLNVVLTSKEINHPDVKVIRNVEEIKNLKGKVFIFGGSKLYHSTINMVEEMYVTEINETFVGDTFFPEYNKEDFKVINQEYFEVSDKNKYPYSYIHMIKK